MRTAFAALTLAIASLLSACATPAPPPLATPSGRPELTIIGVSKKQVMDNVVLNASAKGSQVRSANEYGVVLARRAEGSFAAAFLYGSRYDSIPEARVHLTMADVPKGVKVFARAEMVTNPGSAFERVSDITAAAGNELMNNLREVATRLNAAYE